jgi:hypothetical protein
MSGVLYAVSREFVAVRCKACGAIKVISHKGELARNWCRGVRYVCPVCMDMEQGDAQVLPLLPWPKFLPVLDPAWGVG